MQTLSNQTSKGASSSKIDCAKECPCGVPVIPVPDQWLEVMVTGGFKVWHIIFIIIAFAVTVIVVYCCFHRCRIPRTKQEIEADLMRTNIANKFRDYLQDLPNEPTSFLEALKKVQDLEEKSEKDDAEMARDSGARKRLGWLKLKGKGDKDANETLKLANGKEDGPAVAADGKPPVATDTEKAAEESEPLAAVVTHVPTEPDNQPTAVVDQLSPEAQEGAEQPQEPKSRQAKTRRKQKPNLSRTKRAKERWNGDSESHKPPEAELDKPPPKPHDKLPEKDPAPEKQHTGRRAPKHHIHHRVRMEAKTLVPPDI